MYDHVDLTAVEPRDLEDIAPTLLPVGLELQPENLRPSVWQFEAGEENGFHRHETQEELYLVLEGTVDVTLERGEKREVRELGTEEVLVVPPETWRQLEAVEESRVLAIGAPNEPGDEILEESAGE